MEPHRLLDGLFMTPEAHMDYYEHSGESTRSGRQYAHVGEDSADNPVSSLLYSGAQNESAAFSIHTNGAVSVQEALITSSQTLSPEPQRSATRQASGGIVEPNFEEISDEVRTAAGTLMKMRNDPGEVIFETEEGDLYDTTPPRMSGLAREAASRQVNGDGSAIPATSPSRRSLSTISATSMEMDEPDVVPFSRKRRRAASVDAEFHSKPKKTKGADAQEHGPSRVRMVTRSSSSRSKSGNVEDAAEK